MLNDQTIKKLQQRQGELAEVFVEETAVDKWPDTQTRDTRGDRYWMKKNAAATATLIVKIQTILDYVLKKQPAAPSEPVPGDADDEKEPAGAMAAAAMAEAQDIIDRHQGRFAKKPKK